MTKLKWLTLVGTAILLSVAGLYLWFDSNVKDLPDGLYYGNGRVEGTEIKVAAKYSGRINQIGPEEGDDVEKNEVVAYLDDREARSGLAEARAEQKRAFHVVHSARADINRRESELQYAESQLQRTIQLHERGNSSGQQLDRDKTARDLATAALDGAKGALTQSEALLAAADARIGRHDMILSETEIKAPSAGRVLFRVAEPGEIVPPGGIILLLVDLDRLYMTIYVSEVAAGKIKVGDEALIWTDAYLDKPFPAKVTFIASEAEFTPKEVQTADERQNLVFRVKIRALNNQERLLKPGMPGIGLIRTDSEIRWPQIAPRN